MQKPPRTAKEDADFALDMIRTCSRRLKEIDQQVTTLGTALAQGRMPPRIALQLVDQIAPGCIEAIHFSLYHGVSPEQLHGDLVEKVA
jgi:hypothetical protein